MSCAFVDCTVKCKSAEHGALITAACTKRTVPDDVLLAFLAQTCRNFYSVSDSERRTALHILSATNRTVLVDWLLKNGADVNAKDLESGQTPLHRAVFYGSIRSAIILLQHGAKHDICDLERITPLQYCSSLKVENNRLHRTETHAFGSNSYFNLGLDSDQETRTPKCLEFFRRNGIYIQRIATSAYHSLFLDNELNVYSVGRGVGGRLGHGLETSAVQPQKLNIRLKSPEEKITRISASKNHSLILTDANIIYACGTNINGQLGIMSKETNILEFKSIPCSAFNEQSLMEVLALDNHSLAYSTSSVYAWGLNEGQLGTKSPEKCLKTPQLVLSGLEILRFSACNSGFAFCSQKTLNIFSKYKMKVIKSPNLEAINQLIISDSNSVSERTLKVMVLTESYQIYIWDEGSGKYTKCEHSICPQFEITKISWSGPMLVLLAAQNLYISTDFRMESRKESDDGGVYQEIYKTKKDICQTNLLRIQTRAVPLAGNVKDVWSDGNNCIFIKEDPYMHLEYPKINDENVNLELLLNETSEMDSVHDVLFHVDREIFAAHKYILLSRAFELFSPWIEASEDNKNCFIAEEGLTRLIFAEILKLIYQNKSITTEGLSQMGLSTAIINTWKNSALVRFLSPKRKAPKVVFDRNQYLDLQDVTINCANDRQLKAHKCILVGRLEYFAMMFCSSWMEESVVNFNTMPLDYVEVLLDFLYDSSATRLLSKKYPEAFVINMIVVADLFGCERLKNVFQLQILKRFTMKRTAEMLEVAYTYNCELIKSSIYHFLSANLALALESGILESVAPEYLSELDNCYRNMFPEISYRQMVPSPGIDEEFIAKIAANSTECLLAKALKSDQKRTKELKSNTKTKIDYEKEAKLVPETSETPEVITERSPQKDVQESRVSITQEIEAENKAIWSKVSGEKKDDRKGKNGRFFNANEVLYNESKMGENFTDIRQILIDAKKKPTNGDSNGSVGNGNSPSTPENLGQSINFGDFILPTFSPTMNKQGRKSQKDRKRELHNAAKVEFSPASPPESVWKIPEAKACESNGDLGIKKVLRSSNNVKFDAILVEEKRSKEYLTKLKWKPLTLTQLEESAIAELHAFYNTDQVFDESIEITRKVQHVSQPLSQWASPKANEGSRRSNSQSIWEE